jgi:hypothetical protein
MDEPGVHTVGAGGNAAGKGSGLGGALGVGTGECAQAWAFAVAADKASGLAQVPDRSLSRCIQNVDDSDWVAHLPNLVRCADPECDQILNRAMTAGADSLAKS